MFQQTFKAWPSLYQRQLNVKFLWNISNLNNKPPVEGPTIKITTKMLSQKIIKMKAGKADGPSGIIIAMITAANNGIIDCITSLFNHRVHEDRVPNDWNLSYIINLFKGKWDVYLVGTTKALNRRTIQWKFQSIFSIQLLVNKYLDNMQLSFMPDRGTTHAIFIFRQLQEKYLHKKRNTHFVFVGLENAFHYVQHTVLSWAMQKLAIYEWIIQTVKSMYDNAHSKVRITNCCRKLINVSVGVHQGSFLTPLLFIIVMEAISHAFRIGWPWKLMTRSL